MYILQTPRVEQIIGESVATTYTKYKVLHMNWAPVGD